MSQLGAVSGKLRRESALLRDLNQALLVLQVEALGRRSELGIPSRDVTAGRQLIIDFAERLRSALKGKSQSMELQPIVNHFKSGSRPVEDWIEDLENLVRQLRSEKVASDTAVILENILSLLDEQFTEDLRRLYLL